MKARRDARDALEGDILCWVEVSSSDARFSCVRIETKAGIARACVENHSWRSHLVVIAPFVIVRVTNRASSQ